LALKRGDHAAADLVWARYSRRLAGLARKRLRAAARRVADEQDVALSAFHSVCRRAQQGRFPKLDDRNDLWRLLVLVTLRKAFAHATREQCPSCGGGKVRPLSELDEGALARALDKKPTPGQAFHAAERCRHLLAQLGDDSLRLTALRKLDGCTNSEIVAELGCVEATVERKLQRIRGLWARELED
jgi:DNA-directed RNA polymerase specialized sigma24 family protein